MSLVVAGVLAGVACGSDEPSGAGASGGAAPSGSSSAPPASSSATSLGPLPSVDELSDRPELPDIFTSWDGKRQATTAEDFRTWRSDELRALFVHYLYGAAPPPVAVKAELVAHADDLFDGKVTYDEFALRLGEGDAPPVYLAIFAPAGQPMPPVFVGPNKCGNQSLTSDPRVRATSSFLLSACGPDAEGARGKFASSFPLEMITSRGFALATFHESDAAPDDALSADKGLRPHFVPDSAPETRWGVIATWAWTLSRVVDFLDPSGKIDPARMAVVGHSRRGKTALWAAANDPRIDLVVAHQSGTAGAALTRSLVGESVEAINLFFPHWFNKIFPTFADHEPRIPVDQHQLLALLAPRPVLLTDGDDDTHADPPGARAAAEAADPAWELLGSDGLQLDPATGLPRRDARLVWTSRPGDHHIDEADWQIFLDFASLHLGVSTP